jgi:hydroxyethylthiazole kinase-like uncharacterized protein yjeF
MSLPVISVAQMREWEKASWTAGKSEAEVIRRVGRALAERALRLTRPGDLILVLSGKGNNGADARAAREHLNERRVDTLDVKNPASNFAELESLLAIRPSLVVDGLFGIGLNRPLDADWQKFISAINASKIPVLAVDVPSSLNAQTGEPEGAAIHAAVTLTVGAPKIGMLRQSAWPFVGRLEVTGDVGLTEIPKFASELNWTLAEDFAGFPPARSVAAHKGSFGHVAILAGSLGYHGAAVLASRGAQRAQPGLVTLFPHEFAYMAAAAQLQAVMVRPWTPNLELPGKFSALLAGPGLADPNLPRAISEKIGEWWRTLEIPMIADASALAWLPTGKFPANAIRVITPHPGEAARLLEKTSAEIQADRPAALRALSKKFGGCFVVLKGHQTLVGRSDGEIFVNSSGNPHLAQGGSGDVLSGLLAGLLAQPELQKDPMKTVRYAVWRHGAAADELQESRRSWVVEDLVAALSHQPSAKRPATKADG